MELSYWTSRWRKNKIGFHMDRVYPPLKSYWPRLSLPDQPVVLVPLSGKSLDLQWLWEQGCHVIGVEISDVAVQTFLDTHSFEYREDRRGDFKRYRTERLDLWQGDFMKMQNSYIREPDLVYDKAALVALPEDKRRLYVQTIRQLVGPGSQMLISSFNYPQDEMNGPPFSVPMSEIKRHYGDLYSVQKVHEEDKLADLSKFKRRGLSSFLNEFVCHVQPNPTKSFN